jgi:transcriptional regulator with XRE-family HTH domain
MEDTLTKLYLREWREYRGMALNDLAKITELTPSLISRIEHGSLGWTEKHMATFAEALSIDPQALLVDPYAKAGQKNLN